MSYARLESFLRSTLSHYMEVSIRAYTVKYTFANIKRFVGNVFGRVFCNQRDAALRFASIKFRLTVW